MSIYKMLAMIGLFHIFKRKANVIRGCIILSLFKQTTLLISCYGLGMIV